MAQLLVVFVIQTKRVAATATPFNIFLSIIQLLCETVWTDADQHLNFQSSSSDKSGNISKVRALFHIYFTHPLVGSSPSETVDYNFMWRVGKSAYQQFIDDALYTRQLLQSGVDNAFEDIFL
jgi:hypothetical protein